MNFLNFFGKEKEESRYNKKFSEDQLEKLRHRMVEDQIEARGVRDPRVLEAMKTVPRHKFIADLPPASAYEDRPLPIGENQTISQPYIVALMTEALNVRSTDRVLEIGTGSGYQTAILAEMAEQVYTIERFEELMNNARNILHEIGYENISYRIADGTLGWEDESPFDRIIVTAGAPEVPESLLSQLKEDGGILVIPVGTGIGQELVRIKMEHGEPRREELGACAFVKLVGEEGW